MKRQLIQILVDAIWVFYNVFVNKIPIAFIRKLLYQLGGLKIGSGSRIGFGTIVIQPWKIKIGQNTVVNEYCYLDGRGELLIGDNASISIFSKILTASHKAHDNNFTRFKSKVIIEEQTWIGMSAVVLEGTHLRKGCIVGANGVIKGDTEEKGIYLGNPAKFVKNRIIDEIALSDLSYFK